MKTGIKYSLAFIDNKESIREFFIKLSEDFITFFKGFYQHPPFFTSFFQKGKEQYRNCIIHAQIHKEISIRTTEKILCSNDGNINPK